MWRYGFTLWFALTTLLGPGVCYRSIAANLASAIAPPAVPLTAGPDVITPGGRDEVSSPAPGADRSKVDPTRPVKCPPGVGKRANSLQPRTASNLAADLRLAAGSLPTLATVAVLDATPAGLSESSDFSAPTRLSGRDVLAAYCLLRC